MAHPSRTSPIRLPLSHLVHHPVGPALKEWYSRSLVQGQKLLASGLNALDLARTQAAERLGPTFHRAILRGCSLALCVVNRAQSFLIEVSSNHAVALRASRAPAALPRAPIPPPPDTALPAHLRYSPPPRVSYLDPRAACGTNAAETWPGEAFDDSSPQLLDAMDDDELTHTTDYLAPTAPTINETQ